MNKEELKELLTKAANALTELGEAEQKILAQIQPVYPLESGIAWLAGAKETCGSIPDNLMDAVIDLILGVKHD